MWKRMFGDKKSKSSPTSSSPGICPNCYSKPIAINPITGQYFNHCSRACALQARNSQGPSLVLSLCEHCGIKPKFRDGTRVHNYCGRGCARLAMGGGSIPANSTSLPNLRNAYSTSSISRTTFPGQTCKTPGCYLPVYVGPDGVASKYCKRTHKQWGERGCISCRAAPRNGVTIMCNPCYSRALRLAPVLMEVPEDHENYKSVKTQFEQSWRHPTSCPTVRAVYKIVITPASLSRYEQYQNRVEARGNFVSQGKSRGNENRRWHGTRRKCYIGDKGVTTFCSDPKCSLCSIIKNSYDLKYFKGATGWGRFGAGIYTSSTSSKSNDYANNDGVTSDWNAMLLNKVIVGKGKKLIQDNTTLTRPPLGFDSVLAEVVPGGALNYDELVVYDNDAARPSYLVMYEHILP